MLGKAKDGSPLPPGSNTSLGLLAQVTKTVSQHIDDIRYHGSK
jgi:hypothetical protein